MKVDAATRRLPLVLVAQISLVSLIPQVGDIVACLSVGCKQLRLAPSWTGGFNGSGGANQKEGERET